MKSAHFINKRENGKLIGLKAVDAGKHLYSTEAWRISQEEAESLKGGWVYLHASKAEGSSFGGQVYDIEPMASYEEARFRIYFEAKPEGRDKQWHGYDHGMAWWSGIVEK